MKNIWILFITLSIFGCTKKTYVNTGLETFKGKYAKFLKGNETEIDAAYHFVISKKGKNEFIKRTFYPEKKKLTSLITYSSYPSKIKNGNFKRWYDNGSKRNEGIYLNNKKNGYWKNYHYGESKLSSEGIYKNGEPDGKWKNYDDQGRINLELTWLDGTKEGKFIAYDTLGKIANEGIYKNGIIIKESNPDYKKSDKKVTLPCMPTCAEVEDLKERKKCSDLAIIETINKNIQYPMDAREYGIEGIALLGFIIEKDGSITNIEVLSGLSQSIEKECLKVMDKFPDWEPGLLNEKEKVRVNFTLPIKFQLTD